MPLPFALAAPPARRRRRRNLPRYAHAQLPPPRPPPPRLPGPERFVIIGCGATKRELAEDEEIAACALYTGDLFRKSLAYARTLAPDNRIWIASAFYNLISLDTPVHGYDRALPERKVEREVWGQRVVADLERLVTAEATVELVILAGKGYAAPIAGAAPRHWTVVEPLGRRFIGSRRAWLADHLAPLDLAQKLNLVARQRLAELRAIRRFAERAGRA